MREQTLNELIQFLADYTSKKKALEFDLKDINKEIDTLQWKIMQAMDAEGILQTSSEAGKVSLKESVYAKVEDWDQFIEFIYENRYIHLLEKRVAALAYRELLNLGRPVPGVLPNTVRKLTFKES
jgi:hypothetical protein